MKALFSIQNWFLENVGNIDLATIKNWFLFNPKQPLLFNSAIFLGFFLVFYIIYILSRKTHYFRITYVVLFSLFFYYKSSGIYFGLLIFSSNSSFINSNNALHISRFPSFSRFSFAFTIISITA